MIRVDSFQVHFLSVDSVDCLARKQFMSVHFDDICSLELFYSFVRRDLTSMITYIYISHSKKYF